MLEIATQNHVSKSIIYNTVIIMKLNKILNDFIAKQQANLGLVSPLYQLTTL